MTPIIEYTNAADIIAAKRALHAKFFGLPSRPVFFAPARITPAGTAKLSTAPEPVDNREKTIRDWLNLASPEVTRNTAPKDVLEVVAAATGVGIAEMKSERKTGQLVAARQMACWLMRKHTTLSYPRIGGRLGGRDHTTVLHACRRVEERRVADPDYCSLLTCLSKEILARLTP